MMHNIEQQIILDNESPILKARSDGSNFSIETNSCLDVYIIACAKSLRAITSAIEKASLSLNMLDKKLLSHLDSNRESLSAYIEMLIENSIIRVQVIYDRVLIFTNKVLDLGISNECIGHIILVTNEHVIAFNLVNKLKAVYKACSEYKLIRNTLIHHDRYTEEQLDRLQMVINADSLSRKVNEKGIIDSQDLDCLIDDFLNITKSDLDVYLNGITSKVYDLFDAIMPVYNYQKNTFRLAPLTT